jgi:hypothetical protein
VAPECAGCAIVDVIALVPPHPARSAADPIAIATEYLLLKLKPTFSSFRWEYRPCAPRLPGERERVLKNALNGAVQMRPDELMPTLLDLFPAFRVRWRRHEDLWEGDDTPRSYLDAAEFSRFVIELLEGGESTTLRSAFDCLESMLSETPPDSELAGLIIVGILEGIYLQLSPKLGDANPFESIVGPKTAAGWAYLERTWAGKNSLAEVIEAELRPNEK